MGDEPLTLEGRVRKRGEGGRGKAGGRELVPGGAVRGAGLL